MCAGFFSYLILNGFYQTWAKSETYVESMKTDGVSLAAFLESEDDQSTTHNAADMEEGNPLLEKIELPQTFKMIEQVKHVMFALVVLGTVDYLF